MARWDGPLEKIDGYRWRIPRGYRPGMRVPGLIYASEGMLKSIREEQAAEQVVNVAFLPGIVGHSLAMPDIHWGYGFPSGGWRPPAWMMGWSPRAASATTSTAVSGSCAAT